MVGAVAQEIGDGSGDGAALGGGAHAGTGSALLVFEFVIVAKDQRYVVEGDRAIDAEEPQSRPYERALPATTSP